jgi:hypothetical protein
MSAQGRPRGPIVGSDAHLPAARKAMIFIRQVPQPKRSGYSLVLLVGMVALNETRGFYLAAQLWNAIFG